MIKSGILKPVQFKVGSPKANQRWQRVTHIEQFKAIEATDPSINPRYMWLHVSDNQTGHAECFIIDLGSNTKKRPAIYRACLANVGHPNAKSFIRRQSTVRSDQERQRILKLWQESL